MAQGMVIIFAIAFATVAPPGSAATSPLQSDFGTRTAMEAAQAADEGNCTKSMQIIASDLRDRRFASLPAKSRGEILTVWAGCAQKLSTSAQPAKGKI